MTCAGKSNVRYSAVGPDGRRQELGVSSTGEPGEKSEAFWKSGMVDGHPVTIGLFPGYTSDPPVTTFADGISYAIGSEELKGTGYTMFYIDYSAVANQREPTRPSTIASIRWSDYGIVEGIEGDHRLSGRVFTMSENVTVDVVLRPAAGGRTTVRPGPHPRRRFKVGSLTGTAVSDRMPDGSVIFAISEDISRSPDPGKDSIKAVTWTNADGTRGRIAVTQKGG